VWLTRAAGRWPEGLGRINDVFNFSVTALLWSAERRITIIISNLPISNNASSGTLPDYIPSASGQSDRITGLAGRPNFRRPD
jgi:hypothetical protein